MNDLNRELPMNLTESLEREFISGEKIIISLPGSFGEAFVVSDKRLFVIRDCESGIETGCKIADFPLGNVDSVEVTATSTGGVLSVNLGEPVSDPEMARLYFPSYDVTLFKQAAEEVNKMLSDNQSSQVGVPSASAPTSAGACPSCGAAARNSIYCEACGTQLRPICIGCGSPGAAGAKFCGSCGKEMIEWSPECGKCGNRLQSRWLDFCPECGTVQKVACVACGATIQAGWKHCAHCGRLLGSDRLDPHSVSQAKRRIEQMRASEQEQPSAHSAPAVHSVSSSASAEDRNKRGQELFEEGYLEEAIAEFQVAVALDPNNAFYHCNLAVALDENDQDEEALGEYLKALSIDPNDLTSLLSLGYLYNERNERDKAREVWNRVLEIAPDSAEGIEVKENLRHQDML